MTRVPGSEIRGSLGCGEIQGAKKGRETGSSDESLGFGLFAYLDSLGGFHESKVSL